MLIALALMAVLLTSISGITARFSSDISRSDVHLQNIQDIYYTLNIIEKDLSSYHHGFKTGSNSLEFISLNNITWGDAKRSSQNHIIYEIMADSDNKTTTVYRYEKDVFLKIEPIKTQILQTKQVVFSYLNNKMAEKFVWLNKGVDPLGIIIRITDNNDKIWERIIPLPIGGNN